MKMILIEMKMVLSFFVGAVVGAAVALMFAPSSGEELRGQIHTDANARMHARMDKMQTDISLIRHKDAAEA